MLAAGVRRRCFRFLGVYDHRFAGRAKAVGFPAKKTLWRQCGKSGQEVDDFLISG
jgi:hypothetical protein